MTDLIRQLRGYGEQLDESMMTLEVGDVRLVRVGTGPVRPLLEREPVGRRPAWRRTVAVVAAVVVLAGLGIGTARLAGVWRNETTPVVDQPTLPNTTPSTPQPTTETGDGASFTLTAEDVDPVRVSTVLGDLEFVTFRFPSDQGFSHFNDVTATAHGPVVIAAHGPVPADGETVWWSADYETWHSLPVGADTWGGWAGVAAVGDELLVVHGALFTSPVHSDEMRTVLRFSWEADGWTPQPSIEVPGAGDRFAFGSRGAVAWSGTTVSYSIDGVNFTRAERGPDLEVFAASDEDPEEAEYPEAAGMDCRATFGSEESRIRSVMATDAGFVALTAAAIRYSSDDVICEPYLWFSAGGDTWELVASESPFGERSAVTGIAGRDRRFVAIGYLGEEPPLGQAVVWVSDDALAWRQADMGFADAFNIHSVYAGELGWLLTGFANMPEGGPVDFQMWVSTDGEVWDGPHHLPSAPQVGYLLPEFAVGSDTILSIGPDGQIYVVGRLQDGD